MKRLLISYLKNLYSWFVRKLSNKYRNTPLKKQVCYLMSFPNNNQGLVEEISAHYPVVVLYTKNCQEEASKFATSYCLDSLKEFKEAVKQVCQSQVIIADNYFAFLGDCHFSPNQVVAQLWHATGAIKQFGLEDKQAKNRSNSDKQRFKRVYQAFDFVFVSSEKMAEVFKKSYGFTDQQILYTGFPRTDYLLNGPKSDNQSTKRTILYLPTYRDNEDISNWLLDIEKVAKSLGPEDLLQVKLHPHVPIKQKSSGKVRWIDSSNSADELIKEADVLITDYSSTAFDFTLVNADKRLIMYWPDEKVYRKKTGIQEGIEKDFPNDVTYSTEEVIRQLMQNTQTTNDLFNQKWNTYNDGKATNRVLNEIKHWMEKDE